MKNLIAALLVVMAIVIASCNTPGETSQTLKGNEQNLPEALKGLKVYTVSDGKMSHIKVAVLDNQVIGNSYAVGKSTENVTIINKTITKESVIYENDSIIIIRK